jgi:hypothetical protein
MKIKNIVYAATATLLAACSSESEINVSEQVALQVNATIENAATRTGFTGTSFAKGTEISLFADGGTTPLTYTAGDNGSSFSSTSEYLFNTEKTVKFSAIYPARSEGGEAIAIGTATQSDDLDILFASGKASIYAPELTLKFTHVMSKLTFTLTAGDGFTAQELQDATVTLTGITTDATLSTTTGTLTAGSTKGDVTAAKQQSAGIGGGAASPVTAEAIVVPQSATFTLKVTVSNMDYTKKLTATLAAGTNYSYPVTLNKESMTVGTVSIADWTDKEATDDVSMKYQSPIKTITNKADVRKYDYLMKDGTFLRVPEEYFSSLSDDEKSKIVGIVYWTKEEEQHDDCPDLSTDGQLPADCQHGLVASVNEYSTAWMNTESSTGTSLYLFEDQLSGYSNTLALKEYNEKETTTYPVLAVECITDKDIDNTSGWYLPAERELFYLIAGDVSLSNQQFFYSTDYSTINKYLTLVGTAKLMGDNRFYWTSSENGIAAYALSILSNGTFFSGASIKTTVNYVRPICAF